MTSHFKLNFLIILVNLTTFPLLPVAADGLADLISGAGVGCGAGMCCDMNSGNAALLSMIAPQLSPDILNVLTSRRSQVYSFSPGTKVFSLASGGTSFNFPLTFGRSIQASKANVTFEIERIKSSDGNASRQRIISQCRLSCNPDANRVICDVPNIRGLVPNFLEGEVGLPHQLLALPYDSQGQCGVNYGEIPVWFCFEIKINGDRILFVSTEAQRSSSGLAQLLQGVVSDELLSKLSSSVKPLSVDQVIIYLPDPVVSSASRITQNLTLINGLGLRNDEALDSRFSVALLIDGLVGQVNCNPLDPNDPYYMEHENEIGANGSGIICIFKEKELNSLAERGRHMAVNGTHINVTVAVTAGFWRGTAEFVYQLSPLPPFPVAAVVVPVGFVFLVALAFIICLCVLATGTSPEIKESASNVRTKCPISSICLGFSKPPNEGSFNEVIFSPEILPPEIAAVVESKKLDTSIVKLHEDIGTGHFGAVKRGTLLPPAGSNRREQKPVAVKFIQNCTDKKQLKEFFQEAVHMFLFDHPNVLSAYGVIYGGGHGAPALVLPLMDVGDLRKFVQVGSTQVSDLLIVDFAQQIAEGMAYLANKSLIHRDLAARNCLLNKFRVVKIADFGLSRLATNKDYEYVPIYEMQMLKRPMPIRWMAPECIEHGVFSEKTDIWSYGVLLWELASRGMRPYSSMETPVEVIRYVCVAKSVLPKIPQISETIYSVMMACWDQQPSDRPKFAELAKRTKALLNDPTSPLFLNVSPEKLATRQTGNSETNISETEVESNFQYALCNMSIRMAVVDASVESRHSLPAHTPFPSQRGSVSEKTAGASSPQPRSSKTSSPKKKVLKAER